MKSILFCLAAALLLSCSSLALAEDAPKAEVVKYSEREVRCVKGNLVVPHVIRVFEHIPLYNRRLKYSNRMVWERDGYSVLILEQRVAA